VPPRADSGESSVPPAAGGDDVLERLAGALREEGGLLAAALAATPAGTARHGALAASGPRATGREADYELLVEAIREGYLLHYSAGRVLAPPDPDLALLAGDRLYALGLTRLAELGDLEAVGVLAEVISLSAQAHAAADPELAERVWEEGARAVGHGGSPDGLRELSRRTSQGP
jgi:hypothetical protein